MNPTETVSLESMERLAQLMNDSPTLLKLKGTEWEIHGLKPGTQWLIAEEACKISRNESDNMLNAIKEFSKSMPSVCRVIAMALINDRRIEDENNAYYKSVYDTLMWGIYEMKDWATLLFEILKLIDVDFFYASTNAIATVQQMTLMRKTTMKEQKLSTLVQNGGK